MKRKCAFMLLLCGLVLLSVPGYAALNGYNVSPLSIDFGTEAPGYAQNTYIKDVTITNTTAAQQSGVLQSSITGTDSSAFEIHSGATHSGPTIAAGASVKVQVKPASGLYPGTYSAQLYIHDTNTDNNQTIPLTFSVSGSQPVVALQGTAPSGTVGTIGAQTITVNVTGAFAESIAFTADINGIQKTTISTNGNGTITFDFTAGEMNGLAAGNYPITISSPATPNNYAVAGTTVGTVVVSPAPVAPTFTSTANATFPAGTGGSHIFTATGDALITFTIAEALPTGVTLNNGVLTVDNTAAAGTHTLTVTASNGVLPNATQTFTLNITASPVTPTAPTQITPLNPTVTAGGSTTLTADGNPAPTFALDGSQPAGVTISAGGTLSVASTVAPGTYTFGVIATNIAGSHTEAITLTVKAKSSGGGSSDDWEPVEDIKSYEQAIVIKCREWANVRSGPSTDTEIVGRVYLGESISLLQWNKDETWCKILYDGDSKTGWLYYKFIKPVK